MGDAEKYFLEALQKDGTYPLARINLGYIYMAQGKYTAAGEILLQSIERRNFEVNKLWRVLLAEADWPGKYRRSNLRIPRSMMVFSSK